MAKRWRIRALDPGCVADLARAAGIPFVVAQLLISRGVCDAQQASDFLAAKLAGLRDPCLLPGLSAAARAISDAVRDEKKITVYGDYDADGITSTAILVRCLQALGARVDYYIPNRLQDGYGLSSAGIDLLQARGTQLIVTVDCGISSCDEAAHARRLGIDLIISDHHEICDGSLPDAMIVHTRLPDADYPFHGLAGSGIAFKIAWELCRLASKSDRVTDRLRQLLLSLAGLAALGTVADVVPLTDENRVLVRYGLQALKERSCTGIAALCAVSGLDKKRELNSEDIAFSLGPRINAAGRLGQAELAVELLLTDGPERAHELATFLDELNRQRDQLERSILHDAKKQLLRPFDVENDPAIVLASRDWHVGVIGIVAGRLAERHQRPCILIAIDEFAEATGVGSGRSALGLDLYETLHACRDHLQRFGGHAAAAGLRIRPDRIDEFRRAFFAEVNRRVNPHERVGELRIDAEAPLPQLTIQAVDQIQQLAPFGQSNPRPLLCASAVALDGPPKPMGEGNRHLSLRVKQSSVSLRAIAFGQGDWAPALASCNGPIDVAFRPVINEFRGRRSVELHIVDWRPHQ